MKKSTVIILISVGLVAVIGGLVYVNRAKIFKKSTNTTPPVISRNTADTGGGRTPNREERNLTRATQTGV